MKLNRKLKWASAIGLLVAVVGIGVVMALAAVPTGVTLTATPAAPGVTGWYQVIPSYHVTATAAADSLVGGINAAVDSTATSAIQDAPSGTEIFGTQKAALSEGTHYVYYRAYDTATPSNYTVWSAPTTFQVDVTSPTVSACTAVAIAGGKIRVSGISGADPKPATGEASGVSTFTVMWGTTTTFTVDSGGGIYGGSAVVTAGVTTTDVAPAAGKWYIRIVATDKAGNVSLPSTASSPAVTADNVPPVVTVGIASSTWTTASVTATITAIDTTSGVATVHYRIVPALDNSADPSWSETATVDNTITPTVPTTNSVTALVMTNQGAFKVIASSIDVAGNPSLETSAVYRWDNSIPTSEVNTTTPSAADGPGGKWTTLPTVSLVAKDAAVAASLSVTYAWDHEATKTVAATSGVAFETTAGVSTDGIHTLTFWAVDGAKLVGTTHTETYVVYAYPPKTTIELDLDAPIVDDWYTTVPTATITATNTPGTKAIPTIMYKMDASAFATYTVGLTGFRVTDGTHLITAYAIDASGTVGTETTAAAWVDTIHPVVGLFTPATVYSSNPTLTVAVTETGSSFGTSKVGTASIDSENADVFFSAGTLSFRFVTPLSVGPNSVTIVVTDAAGNESAAVIDVVDYVNSVTLSASAGSHGSISPAGNLSASVNTTENYTVVADQGYHIASLLVDGSPVSAAVGLTTYPYALAVGTSNHAILASFAIDRFAMTITPPTNGTIVGPTSADYGTNAVYTITAASGFRIVGVTDNGVAHGALASYTVSNVQETHTIAATFAVDVTPPPGTVTLSASAGSHGSISPAGNLSASVNTTENYTVVADQGYHIASLLVDGSPVSAAVGLTTYPYALAVGTSNRAILVSFAIDSFAMTITPPANGTIVGPTSADYGTNAVYTITPASGFRIVGVTDNGVAQGALASYTVSNVHGTHTIAATFELIPVPAVYTITKTVVGNGSIGGPTSVASGSDADFSVVAAAGSRIVSVKVGGVDYPATFTLTNVTANQTITATFETIPVPAVYTITKTVVGNGSIGGPVSVTSGADADYVVTPAAGSRIVSVKVGGVDYPATFTLTNVTANLTIAATFELIPAPPVVHYAVSTILNGNGTITGDLSPVAGSNSSYVVAAATGYHVVSVTLDGALVGTSFTINGISENHIIVATFAANVPAKLATYLSFRATTHSIRSGNYVTLFVKLSGGRFTNQSVRFEVKMPGKGYGLIRTATVTAAGYAHIHYKVGAKGTRYLRARFTGDSTFLAAPVLTGWKLLVH